MLKSDEFERFNRRTALLRDELILLPDNELVIIDEIQKIPALLDEVHWLISNKNLRFILSGSSAHKLRRSGVNLLGGRAIRAHLFPLVSPGSPEFGHAFEHLVIQELIAYLSYSGSSHELSYWRTSSGFEVDAIIGAAHTAIEIKSNAEVHPHHAKGLKAFAEEFPDARLLLVSMDKYPRTMNGIEVMPVNVFLKLMWEGLLF